jgi:hypothetical protein
MVVCDFIRTSPIKNLKSYYQDKQFYFIGLHYYKYKVKVGIPLDKMSTLEF